MSDISIYGMSNCVGCSWAKSVFDRLGVEYRYTELGVDMSHADFKSAFPDVKHIPLMFDNGTVLSWQTFKEKYESRITNEN